MVLDQINVSFPSQDRGLCKQEEAVGTYFNDFPLGATAAFNALATDQHSYLPSNRPICGLEKKSKHKHVFKSQNMTLDGFFK